MVRAWNVPPSLLDDKRLLGQHVESHIMYNSQVKRAKGIKAGWQNHPQTRRFDECSGMLVDIHRLCVDEMKRRGFKHNSPLPEFFGCEPFVYSRSMFLSDLIKLYHRWGKTQGLS